LVAPEMVALPLVPQLVAFNFKSQPLRA